MIDILSPAMPLVGLTWYTTEMDTTEFELTRLLQRVSNYHRTIKHLTLNISGKFPNLDKTAVQNMLSKCTHLLPFICKNFPQTFTDGNTWCLTQHSLWFEENDI
ncbi:unnamed protein product [Lymnaea stagnalis]|uniref:Uncharacterized protein n=1 Tax=Lymnaea stagnalis TaxID=6523 RepID=A0AAV2HLJ2_LYMST